jgi:hypothetical protein
LVKEIYDAVLGIAGDLTWPTLHRKRWWIYRIEGVYVFTKRRYLLVVNADLCGYLRRIHAYAQAGFHGLAYGFGVLRVGAALRHLRRFKMDRQAI